MNPDLDRPRHRNASPERTRDNPVETGVLTIALLATIAYEEIREALARAGIVEYPSE